VSLPELPLLGVLPGTGGLTRVTTSGKSGATSPTCSARRAKACAPTAAKQWKLVDHIAKPQAFKDAVRERVSALTALSTRGGGKGVTLKPLRRTIDAGGYHYDNVDAVIDRKARTRPSRSSRRGKRFLPASMQSTLRAMRGGRSRWRASSTMPS